MVTQAVAYDAILGVGNNLRQVQSSNYSHNGTIIRAPISGLPASSEIYGGKIDQVISQETRDILGGLAALDPSLGLLVAAGVITVPYNDRANGGTFEGTLSHTSLTIADALIVPKSLTSNQEDEAVVMGLDIHPLDTNGDGLNPVVKNTGVTLAPSAFGVQYAMGPANFNATAVPGLVGWDIDFGITVEKKWHDGLVFPQKAFIREISPVMNFRFESMEALDTFTTSYKAMTAADCYGRKRLDGSTFVPDATAQHLKMTFTAGLVNPSEFGATGREEAKLTVALHGKVLTGSTTSAIT